MKTSRWTVLAGVLLACSVGQAQETRDFAWCLKKLTDLDGLPVLTSGVRCAMGSSYDRRSKYDPATDKYTGWDANGDSGQYYAVDTARGEAVMADIKGPGVIWRIWSANPQSKLRVYFDGATTPSFEWDFNGLFSGKLEPFRRPLVWQRPPGGRASDCFVPLPFANGCRVTAVLAPDKNGNLRPPGQYYAVQYHTFAPGTPVQTFHLPLTAAETELLGKVCDTLGRAGEDPQPKPVSEPGPRAITVPAGGEVTLADLRGPATVQALRAKLASTEFWACRKVLLRAYWDDNPRPAIEAPVEAFFGEGFHGGLKAAEKPYTSLPLGKQPDGLYYSFWRMPFAQHAVFKAVNLGTQEAQLTWQLRVQPGPLAPDTANFYAKWHCEQPATQFEYPFLDVTGRGTYVGMALFTDNAHGGWWGEGDEKVYVDGEKFPCIFGTGSEDFFGDAWGIGWFNNPYHGSTDPHERKQSCRRYQVAEHIPFDKSFRMTIENYAWRDQTKNSYASVAYWYAAPGAVDAADPANPPANSGGLPGAGHIFTTPTLAELVPWGRIAAGAVEAEALKLESSAGPTPAVDESSYDWSWNKGWVQRATAVGEGFTLSGDLGRRGPWVVSVGLARDVDCGRFTVSFNGQPAPFELDGYAPERGHAELSLGEVELPAGPVKVEFKVTGKADAATGYKLGIDYLLLKPVLLKGALEGEQLKVLAAVGSQTTRQDLSQGFSGGTQLWFPNHTKDGYFTVEVPVAKAGRYALNLFLCTAIDYAIAQVELDGQVLGQFDAYHDGVKPSGVQPFGVHELTAGKHKLTLRAIGKHERSTGYMIGLDALQLAPQP